MESIYYAAVHNKGKRTGRKRILEFNPHNNEHLYLSYSIGCEDGPGIKRDGLGPPKMNIKNRPWETTTDSSKQREGTWFIFEDNLSKDEKEYCHASRFKKEYDDKEILYILSFGDLTMNLWNVGYINNKITKEPKLIYLPDEPIDKRIYTCFVKFKDQTYLILPLRFNRYEFRRNPISNDVIINFNTNKGIANDIEFAIFGQQIIRDNKIVDVRQSVHQFSDLRHLLSLPNINPSNSNYKFFYGKEQQGDIWFGESQLIDDRNLRRAALSGSIELNRLYKGLGCPKEHLENILDKSNNEYIQNETYRTLREGEWRNIPENEHIIEIFLRRNTYPCTMLGLNNSGKVLSLAWNGGYGIENGWTIDKTAEIFNDEGNVEDAILCDEGTDVMQSKEIPDDNDIICGRKKIRAVLIVAKPKNI